MKKALLWLLLLTVPFTFGCPSPRNDNAGNTNAGNTNAGNTNTGNTNGAPALLRDAKNKAIQIYVYEEGGVRKLSIAPETMKLSLSKGQRLRFSIFNGLDVDISRVRIVLSGTGDGFDGGDGSDGGKVFKRGEIDTGTEGDTNGGFRKPKTQGSYTYKVYIDEEETETKTERPYEAPQIEIGG